MEVPGPFGLCPGQPLSSLSTTQPEIAPFKYLLTEVPRPHSAFKDYIVQVSPKNGLSWIKALGHTQQTSTYGVELATSFEAMLQKLELIYSKCKRFDFLMPDSIWNEPRDWMQAMMNKERVLAAEWKANGHELLKGGVAGVYLYVAVNDVSSGYIAIEYSFQNAADASAEIAALEDDAL